MSVAILVPKGGARDLVVSLLGFFFLGVFLLGIGHTLILGDVGPADETFAFAACVPLLAGALPRALTAAAVVLVGSIQGTEMHSAIVLHKGNTQGLGVATVIGANLNQQGLLSG